MIAYRSTRPVIGEYDTNCPQPGPAHLYVTTAHDALDCDARTAESVGNANAPQRGQVTWVGRGNAMRGRRMFLAGAYGPLQPLRRSIAVWSPNAAAFSMSERAPALPLWARIDPRTR